MISRTVAFALCLMGVAFYLLFLWALIADYKLRRSSERSAAQRNGATSQNGSPIRTQLRFGSQTTAVTARRLTRETREGFFPPL